MKPDEGVFGFYKELSDAVMNASPDPDARGLGGFLPVLGHIETVVHNMAIDFRRRSK